MNAAPLGLVVGRASGRASAVFGLLAAGGGRWDGTRAGKVGREVDGEDGELARGVGAKPDVVHMFVMVVERRIRPVEGGADTARGSRRWLAPGPPMPW